jgi:hypothetical protein
MSRRNWTLLLVVFVTAALCALGCKDDKKGGEGGEPAAAAKKADGPKIDCGVFTKKMLECGEQFKAAYAKTESAKRAGQGDGEKGAGYFMMGFKDQAALDMIGTKMCADEYAKKDPRWQDRYTKCDAKAACDAWAACVAPAIGDPLPIRK